MVELGAREAIMTTTDGCFAQVLQDGRPQLYRARMEPLEPRASVGSGDAFLAGYVAARYAGEGPGGCLRYGTACGAESTQHLGAGVLDARAVDRLMDEISVEQLELPAEVG
jgi:1-phosphofructokinase/tagatose 6-phosphate kinase